MVIVAHVSCIRALCERDTVKSHAVMPLCMALTNDMNARPATCNLLIQCTLGLNFMPFWFTREIYLEELPHRHRVAAIHAAAMTARAMSPA